MRWLRELALVAFVLTSCKGAAREYSKKSSENLKRAVDSYAHAASTARFDDLGNGKSKVIVETIKSISPSEYLTSTGFIGSTFEANTPTGKVPLGSVSFNAFEPVTDKEEATASSTSTETTTPVKKKSSYSRYSYSHGSSQKASASSAVGSSTTSSSIRTTSLEPTTTLLPAYQISSRSSDIAGELIDLNKPIKIIATRGKIGNGRITLQRIVKKPSKAEAKHSDSKPEETGLHGYHYDVGSLGFDSNHHGGSQPGMMGTSYMRQSSPFYNFHVMLD